MFLFNNQTTEQYENEQHTYRKYRRRKSITKIFISLNHPYFKLCINRMSLLNMVKESVQGSKPGLWHVFSTLPHRNRFLLAIKTNDKKVPPKHNQGEYLYRVLEWWVFFGVKRKEKKKKGTNNTFIGTSLLHRKIDIMRKLEEGRVGNIQPASNLLANLIIYILQICTLI